jgi:hypothetical protein
VFIRNLVCEAAASTFSGKLLGIEGPKQVSRGSWHGNGPHPSTQPVVLVATAQMIESQPSLCLVCAPPN